MFTRMRLLNRWQMHLWFLIMSQLFDVEISWTLCFGGPIWWYGEILCDIRRHYSAECFISDVGGTLVTAITVSPLSHSCTVYGCESIAHVIYGMFGLHHHNFHTKSTPAHKHSALAQLTANCYKQAQTCRLSIYLCLPQSSPSSLYQRYLQAVIHVSGGRTEEKKKNWYRHLCSSFFIKFTQE